MEPLDWLKALTGTALVVGAAALARDRFRRPTPVRAPLADNGPAEDLPVSPPPDPDGFIPMFPTRLSPRTIKAAVERAWPEAFPGETADPEAVEILLAQWGIETGNGASMKNYNLGNVKRVKGKPWTMFPGTWEVLSKVPSDAARSEPLPSGKFKVIFEPPHPQTHFSAFQTLEEGAVSWLRKMKTRFSKAWPYALEGDTEGFSKALKSQGYYTQDEDKYTAALVSRRKSMFG